MDEKYLFERWYGRGCTDAERKRMFEQMNGHYKLQQCCDAFRAFSAALDLMKPLHSAAVKMRDCDWVITLPDRMDGVRKIASEALATLDT